MVLDACKAKAKCLPCYLISNTTLFLQPDKICIIIIRIFELQSTRQSIQIPWHCYNHITPASLLALNLHFHYAGLRLRAKYTQHKQPANFEFEPINSITP